MTPAAATPVATRARIGPRGRFWPSRPFRADAAVLAMVLVLPVVKVLMVASVSPSIYPDSKTYRVIGTWLNFSLTSLDGLSLRPWGVTGWLALWPNDRVIMFAQALLSSLAWGALALAVAGLVANRVVRIGVAASFVLLACTAQIASWDSVILGDSASMSAGILSLAAFVWFVREPRWGRAGIFAVLALWFTMTRPNVFVVLLGWVLALLVIGLLRRRLVVWVVALVLVAFSVYSYAYNVHTDAAWTKRYGYSRSTVSLAYPIGPYNPAASSILADLRKSDAPRCMLPAGPVLVAPRGPSAWVKTTFDACPEMNTWATANWQHWYMKWLLTHPGDTIQIIDSQITHSLTPSIWGSVVAATPNSVAQLYLGTPDLPQDAIKARSYTVQPLILWLLGGVALAVAATRRRQWRGTGWPIDLALAGSVVGGLLSAITSGLLIQTMPFEVAQESLASAAVVTAAAVAAVAMGLDRVLGPRVARVAVAMAAEPPRPVEEEPPPPVEEPPPHRPSEDVAPAPAEDKPATEPA